jgi:hypothetical protein
MSDQQPGGESGRSFARRAVLLARAHPGIALAALVCGAAILYFTLGRLWTRQRDKVSATLDGVVKGLVDGDADEVMAWVSPYFSTEGLDKHGLGDALGHLLKPGLVTRASLRVSRFNLDNGTATAAVEVGSSHGGGFMSGSVHSEWLVSLQLINGRWLIRAATPVQVDRVNVPGLRALLARHY